MSKSLKKFSSEVILNQYLSFKDDEKEALARGDIKKVNKVRARMKVIREELDKRLGFWDLSMKRKNK